jgi:hypothetical protein
MKSYEHINPVAKTIISLSTLIVIVLILACAEMNQPVSVPTSNWKGGYNFTWDPVQNAPVGSLRVTMAIVDPLFVQQNEYITKHDPVAKGFTRSLSIDLDKLLIAKGMTVTGPFESLDAMTYPDKKNADLSLTPDLIMNVTVKQGGWTRNGQNLIMPVEVTVDGSLSLVMREPLSSEKIWIKKLPFQSVTKSGQVVAKAQTLVAGANYGSLQGKNKVSLLELMNASGKVVVQPGEIVVDGEAEAMADCIKDSYKPILDTVWNYINGQEVKILKEKATEVRKLKRY